MPSWRQQRPLIPNNLTQATAHHGGELAETVSVQENHHWNGYYAQHSPLAGTTAASNSSEPDPSAPMIDNRPNGGQQYGTVFSTSTRPPEHDQIFIGNETQTSLELAHTHSQVIAMGNADCAEESASELSTSPSASSSGASAPDFLLAFFAGFLAFSKA